MKNHSTNVLSFNQVNISMWVADSSLFTRPDRSFPSDRYYADRTRSCPDWLESL